MEEKRRSLSLSSDVGLYSQSGDQEGGPEGDGVGSDRKGGGLGNLFCGRPDRALLPRETQLLRVGTALRSTIQK